MYPVPNVGASLVKTVSRWATGPKTIARRSSQVKPLHFSTPPFLPAQTQLASWALSLSLWFFLMIQNDNPTRPKLAVIDYGMGNLRSVVRAWQHVGAEAYLAASPDAIGRADALIFPGQGAITDAMRLLRATGFDRVIRDWVAADRPFFGICLGLQALFEHSEEGDVAGLGVFKGEVRRFRLDSSLKIPHMGWNSVTFEPNIALTDGLQSGQDQFYFVHSFYIEPANLELATFHTDYGGRFVAGIQSGNCYAVQFHPEKSQVKGLQLYGNFLRTL